MNPTTTAADAMLPKKPNPTFPLSAHRNGQWFTTRRIAGCKQFFYFGRWQDDPTGERAFAAWLLVAEDLRARRMPVMLTQVADGVTCLEIADRFVSYSQRRMELGEIKPREFADTRLACMGHFVDGAGEKTPANSLDTPRIVSGRADPVTPLQQLREHLMGRMGRTLCTEISTKSAACSNGRTATSSCPGRFTSMSQSAGFQND
jgi:hypothetical protein